MRSQQAQIPKVDKWAHMLPDMIKIIESNVEGGWDVAFVDGWQCCWDCKKCLTRLTAIPMSLDGHSCLAGRGMTHRGLLRSDHASKYAGFGVWSGEGDGRNEQSAVPVTEGQSITREELRAALRALQNKCP